jgi:hypothetical protein
MGGMAMAAIILAIVVGIKTFSDPTSVARNPPTELISGQWIRATGEVPLESSHGTPTEYLLTKDLISFDASNAIGSSGTVALTYADGSIITAKVMLSENGNLVAQVSTKTGKLTQISISQFDENGPLYVSDGLSSIQFEAAK